MFQVNTKETKTTLSSQLFLVFQLLTLSRYLFSGLANKRLEVINIQYIEFIYQFVLAVNVAGNIIYMY